MLRLAVRVDPDHAELVLAELLELAPSGVEESGGPATGYVEYAIYGAPGELPDVGQITVAAGDALVDVVTTEIADDWADRWRAFHRPITIAGQLHVRPPWEPEPGDGLCDIVIDPGQAFGTGAHATTRLCLELLCGLGGGASPVVPDSPNMSVGAAEGHGPGGGASPAVPDSPNMSVGAADRHVADRHVVVDVGCGSGVLAVAAACLGYGPVLGLDHERESVAATIANAAVNGVADLVDARRFDLLRDGRLPSAPLVLANLLRPLLLCVARVGWEGPGPQTLIASGLLEHEADEVAAAFAAHGLAERRRLCADGWAALQLGS